MSVLDSKTLDSSVTFAFDVVSDLVVNKTLSWAKGLFSILYFECGSFGSFQKFQTQRLKEIF